MATTTITTFDGQGNVIAEEVVTVSESYGYADVLRLRVDSALATNATYLAVATPTAAQTTAQVKALTRECSALIRLLIGRLESTD